MTNRPSKPTNIAVHPKVTGKNGNKPSRIEAERAVQTLLRWAGDEPNREGLLDTPKRVVRAYEEFFAGYDQDPVEYLKRTFDEIQGYDELVLLRDIRFESFCEHHLAPIIGKIACFLVESSPCKNSLLISKVTKKKKIAISASLIQCNKLNFNP